MGADFFCFPRRISVSAPILSCIFVHKKIENADNNQNKESGHSSQCLGGYRNKNIPSRHHSQTQSKGNTNGGVKIVTHKKSPLNRIIM